MSETTRRVPSMKDVATLAGVSIGTVSNVLNAPARVGASTRERVDAAIAALGWTPNESARHLRAGKSLLVGMVVMDITNPFFADIFAGAEDAAHLRGYSIQLGNSANDAEREATHLRLFEKQRVRGVLLSPIGQVGKDVERFRRAGVPVVLVDRTSNDLDCCSVALDDVEGGRLAVAHLIAAGHTSIAIVGGPSTLEQVRQRRQGGQTAATVASGTRVTTVSTPRLDVDSGVSAAHEIAALPETERPTAVFALNDLLAIGLLQGFVTLGMRVPEDMAIVGYDDIAFASSAAVPLSAVRQPCREIGRIATELLFSELDDLDQGRPHTHRHVRLMPELVVRRSSAVRG